MRKPFNQQNRLTKDLWKDAIKNEKSFQERLKANIKVKLGQQVWRILLQENPDNGSEEYGPILRAAYHMIISELNREFYDGSAYDSEEELFVK